MAKTAKKGPPRGAGRPSDVKEGEIRQAIRQAAIELIGEKGFNGTSIAEIAEQAGTTKPMVYYYYESKDKMLRKISEEVLQGNMAIMVEIMHDQSLTNIERISNMLGAQQEQLARSPELMRFFHRLSTQPQAIGAFSPASMTRLWYEQLLKLVDEGIKRGEFSGDPSVVTACIQSLFHYNVMMHFAFGKAIDKSIVQDSKAMFAHMLAGIGN